MSIIAIHVNKERWDELRALIDDIEGPHEHYDGMNECNICDEPVIDAAIRLLHQLEQKA